MTASNSTGTTLPADSRRPSTWSFPWPESRTRVDLKRTSGCSSMAESSVERRRLSHIPLPVTRLRASTVSSILGPSGPTSYKPATRSKRPRAMVRPQVVATSKSTPSMLQRFGEAVRSYTCGWTSVDDNGQADGGESEVVASVAEREVEGVADCCPHDGRRSSRSTESESAGPRIACGKLAGS